MQSHPSWVRGLKHLSSIIVLSYIVAPLVGAWIETMPKASKSAEGKVAPLVGAWIETGHAARLKAGSSVAPLVGAWIETVQIRGKTHVVRSHPSWVRGLKHRTRKTCNLSSTSHPSWVRGLKHLTSLWLKQCIGRTPRGCVD